MRARSLQAPVLPAGELWLLDVDRVAAEDLDVGVLPEAERLRNGRFATPVLRRRDLTTRLWMRELLAARTGQTREKVQWTIGPHGKPRFGPQAGHRLPSFNLSHSGRFAVFGMSESHEIGVDIECLREFPSDELEGLARSIMTHAEVTALEQLPEADRSRALLTAWTRKEACVKALGIGLSLSVATLETGITVAPVDVTCRLPGSTSAPIVISVRSAELAEQAICSTAWYSVHRS